MRSVHIGIGHDYDAMITKLDRRDGLACLVELPSGRVLASDKSLLALVRKVRKAAREGVAWVRRSLAGSERVAGDAKRLKRVLAMDLGELCKRQCGN